MGLYSNNRTSLSQYDIPASGKYVGEAGMATLLYEATQEDMKFFDLIIANDFREAELVAGDRGFVTESTQEIITEGVVDTLKSAWTKLKEFVKKIIAKIKSIFKSLVAKIEGVFCTDNKKLAEKYKKDVLSKSLSDMKYKWGDSKNFGNVLSGDTTKIEKPTQDADLNKLVSEMRNKVKSASGNKDVEKARAEIESHWTDDLYYMITGFESRDELRKEAFEEEIGTVEELTDGADSKKHDVYRWLLSGNKLLAKIKDMENKITSAFNSFLKEVDQREKKWVKVTTETKDDNIKDYSQIELLMISTERNLTSTMQTAKTDGISILLEVAKKELAICRSFWTKAATYKTVMHNSALLNAIDESAEYEVESSLGL